MSIIEEIAGSLDFSEDQFRELLQRGRRHVKIYTVRKRNGSGVRRIVVPPRPFKLVQYWLIRNRLRRMPISEHATAYAPGASVFENASRHRGGQYFVKMDLKDFFSSITADDFFEAIKEDEDDLTRGLGSSFSDEDFLFSLFLSDKDAFRCAIGYPASPYIANICMRSFDRVIWDRLSEKTEEVGVFSYTRYADDITISVERKGFKKTIVELVNSVVDELKSPQLKVNEEKTKFGSKRAGSALITGLRVCKDGRLTLHKKYKDHVRLLLSLYARGELDESERSSLEGHLNYCAFSDPSFYNKLVSKNMKAVERLKG